jgi:hypothetical protein
MLDDWPHHDQLDGRRIGAFGFSNGGFTVLVAAGGIPDLGKTGPYCQANPDHDLCQALKRAGIDPRLGSNASSDAWTPDPRIKAAVIAGPHSVSPSPTLDWRKFVFRSSFGARQTTSTSRTHGIKRRCAPLCPTRLSITSSLAPAITTSCRRAVRA